MQRKRCSGSSGTIGRFGEFIGGAWIAPKSGEYQTTSDPSTGEVLAEVAKGNIEGR